jgi:L-asparaginase
LRELRSWPTSPSEPARRCFELMQQAERWPRVEIVLSHAEARGSIVDVLIQERQPGAAEPVQGLVIAATGNGTLHESLEAAALRAQAAGIAVVRATRCPQGRILPTPGAVLRDAGALTPVKARIALALELMATEPGG